MIPEEPAAVADNSFGRPQISRKSSFSDAINKFTTTTFNRRRTTNVLPHSASSTHFHHKSRLPTPSGIPRSTSFLSSLGNFVSNTTDPHTYQDENDPPQPSGKRSRRISDRLAQTPFVQQQSSHPSIPTAPATQSKRRESCVKIEQRGLMQPMPPPLPKSSTMGDLLSAHTTCSTLQLTPNASRPASSLADRKGSLVTNKRGNVLTPPMRVVRLQKAPGSFPKRKDSLMPPPSRAIDVLHDAGNEAGAAHSSSPISSYAEEDTVLRVSNKQGKSAYRYESMIGKQYSSFKEEFDTENPPRLQEIKADENPPSIKTDQHNNKQESSNESAAADPDDIDNPRLIHSPKPPTYWLGRFTALSDTTRCSALASSASPTTTTENRPDSSSALSLSDHHHSMHNAVQRHTAVFSHLRALCLTDEARESLAVFEGLMRNALEEEERRCGEGRKGMRKSVGGGVREKKGWLEGLMGRRRASGEKE